MNKKKHLIVSLLIFFISFFLYTITSGRTISFGDSGESVTAAYNLLPLHPPGYPLYSILGKIFTLIPVGEIAFRVNIMSAFFASLALVFLYLIVFYITKNLLSSIIAVTSFMVSITLWSYSHFAKGYTLNLFFLSVLIFCALKYRENKKWLYLWGLFFGLSLTYHYQSMIILLPAFIYIFIIQGKPSLREVGIALSLIIVCLLLYLFIPLRAIMTPLAYHWGDPTTVKGFFAIITGKIYGWQEATTRTGLSNTLHQLGIYGTYLLKSFNYPGVITGLIGFILFARKNFKIFLFTLIIYSTNVLLISYLISTEVQIFLEAILPGFFLPAHFIFAIWIGYCLCEITKKIKIKSLSYLFFIIPFLSLILNYPICYERNNFLAYDFARNCLLTPEEDSILITSGDNDTFPIWYLQEVEHFRTDIKLITLGLIGEPSYNKYLQERLPWKVLPGAIREEIIMNFIKDNPTLKVYLTYHAVAKLPPNLTIAPRGILYEVALPNRKHDLEICSTLMEKKYNLRGISDSGVYKDLLTSSMMGPYARGFYELGAMYLDKNLPDKAKDIFKMVGEIDYSLRKDIGEEFTFAVDFQMAKLSLQEENWDRSLKLLEGKETLLKDNPVFYSTRGSAYRGKKMYQKALEDLNYALKLAPRSAKINLELGKLYYDTDDIKEALYKFAIAIQLDPSISGGHYWLGECYRHYDLKEKAIKEYGEELRLYPDYQPAIDSIKKVLGNEK